MKYSILFIYFFKLAIRCEKKKRPGSGRVRPLNLTVPLGSDDLGYGPGSGFSLKPVQTSRHKLHKNDTQTCQLKHVDKLA